MKAITTRYIGMTERRPARIIARDADNNRITVAVSTLNGTTEEQHRAAAERLRDSMRWTGELVGGYQGPGWVWVFVWPAGEVAK